VVETSLDVPISGADCVGAQSVYSWRICTTFAGCKTVITVVLTVKSDMDLHMITQDFGWFGICSVVRISSWS
jgi:hypothetical protein